MLTAQTVLEKQEGKRKIEQAEVISELFPS
jgi:hypothetical protein